MLKKLRNFYKWMRKIVLNTDYKSCSMSEIWSEVVLFWAHLSEEEISK